MKNNIIILMLLGQVCSLWSQTSTIPKSIATCEDYLILDKNGTIDTIWYASVNINKLDSLIFQYIPNKETGLMEHRSTTFYYVIYLDDKKAIWIFPKYPDDYSYDFLEEEDDHLIERIKLFPVHSISIHFTNDEGLLEKHWCLKVLIDGDRVSIVSQ